MRTTRKILYRSPDEKLILKGLWLPSIREAPIPVTLNGERIGKFQGAEFYVGDAESSQLPLMAVDLIANCFQRITYRKHDGSSGTLGTSVMGSPGFRTRDKVFHYLPVVQKAHIQCADCFSTVTIFGSFCELAEVESVRTYDHKRNATQTTVNFRALKSIELDRTLMGTDAFRFITLSSMHAGKIFDADCIRHCAAKGPEVVFPLTDKTEREKYLLRFDFAAERLSLLRSLNSLARRGKPGAIDAPSIEVTVKKNSGGLLLGAQAYLSETLNVNDDSLTAWAEWIEAPAVIPAGAEYRMSFGIQALAPG